MKDQVIANKPKKQRRKKIKADTVVSILLDMSGSMASIQEATREGLNGYLDTLRNDNKNTDEVLVSITVFDCGVEYSGGMWSNQTVNRINTIFNLVPLSDIPKITRDHYAPSGGTPLYDAMGEVINRTDESLRGIKGNPDVLFVIITDGEDLHSTQLTDKDAKLLIEEKQGKGWTPIYLGANQDAWKVSGMLGISRGSTKSYAATNEGVKQDVFQDLGTRTHAHRMAKGAVYSANFADAGTYSTNAFFEGDDDDVEGIVEEMTKGALDTQASADTEEKEKSKGNNA